MLQLSLLLAFFGLASTQLHPHLIPPAPDVAPQLHSRLIHPDQTRAILHSNFQQQSQRQRNNFRVVQNGFQPFVHNSLHDPGQTGVHNSLHDPGKTGVHNVVQNGLNVESSNGFQNGFHRGGQNVQNGFQNVLQNNIQNGLQNGAQVGLHQGLQNGAHVGLHQGLHNGIKNGFFQGGHGEHYPGVQSVPNVSNIAQPTVQSIARNTTANLTHNDINSSTQNNTQNNTHAKVSAGTHVQSKDQNDVHNGHQNGIVKEIHTKVTSTDDERRNQTARPKNVHKDEVNSSNDDQTASSTKHSSSTVSKQVSVHQPPTGEKSTKNHALFYRSATSGSTNKHHRESTKVEIPANKTVEEILQWLQSRYKAVNLRKAREDLSRVYLPSELSSTLEPRPFQTQKISSSISTTPATSPQSNTNQRQSTSSQSGNVLTTNYNEQAPLTGDRPAQPQTGYQVPFQTQTPFSLVQDTPRAYNTPNFQTSTQQNYQPQSQLGYQPQVQQNYQPQSYQPTDQGYPTQQGYQPTQQGYQPTQQGYQPGQPQSNNDYQPQNAYQPATQQNYQPITPQTYQPSSSPQPAYQPTFQSVSTGYSVPAQPNYSPEGPTYSVSSSTYGPGDYNPATGDGNEGQSTGYSQPSRPSGLDDEPNYQEPVNTIQPPLYTSDGDVNQLYTNTYQKGSSSPSSTGAQSDLTSIGYQPGIGIDQPGRGSGDRQQQIGQHPPHIHELNVVCSKESMIVNIEFNEVFNGVIYSKGHHNEEECRYVRPSSNSAKYSFTLKLNSCGTQYIEDFASGKPAYLENTLVIQNEPGILEIWDYIRNVRCLWEGSITQSLSTGLSIDGLNQEVVTFSGDTAKAKLELQAGRGPFSNENVNLVRIGDLMTLVISVEGDNGFNIRVGECIASDGQPNTFNRVSLTDDRGCTVKEKVMGGFQFTRNPSTGASIAYAFFRAFKFPDVMELAIECSVQLCKTECAPCPDPNQVVEPRRRRRWIQNITEDIFEELRLKNKIQVFLPEELPNNWPQVTASNDDLDNICVSPHIFYSSWSAMLFVTLLSTFGWVYFWYKATSFTKKYFK